MLAGRACEVEPVKSNNTVTVISESGVRNIMKFALFLVLSIGFPVSPAPLRAAEPPFNEGIHHSYDLDVAWKCGMEQQRYTVTGTIRNTWVDVLSDLELTVRMFSQDGSEIGRATYYFIPRDYSPGDSSFFGIAVQIPEGRQVKRLEFRFSYYVDTDDFGMLPEFTSFDADVADPGKHGGGTRPEVRKGDSHGK